jgi:hypothetical protein
MRLDMKKRFTEEQIIGFLREAEAGIPIAELCLNPHLRIHTHLKLLSELASERSPSLFALDALK